MIGPALALGVATSLHCAAMCGPLAVAAGGRARYFVGRLVSYAAAGALFGALGEHALCRLPIGTVQVAALAVVAAAALGRAFRLVRPARVRISTRRPRRLLARLWAHLPRDAFALGLATGLLPCGLLVPAWALAATAGDAGAGALTMAAFALASTPGLAAPLVGRRWLPRPAPRLEAAAWCALALWLALRPLLVAAACHSPAHVP
jgi:sulfite exporter TauE/SafE